MFSLFLFPLHFRRRRAFTLLELLAVLVINVLAAAVVLPLLAQARQRAQSTACLANMKQIGIGLQMYLQDNDLTFPVSWASAPPVNGGTDNALPLDRQLAPYLKTDAVWQCPSDPALERILAPVLKAKSVPFWDGHYDGARPGGQYRLRSYGYVGSINTRQAADEGRPQPDLNTGVTWYRISHALASLDQPNQTVTLVESNTPSEFWVMGTAWGSLWNNCDAWKLAGRGPGADSQFAPGCEEPWKDRRNMPFPGHLGRANYLFGDGHVETLSWAQARDNDFSLFKRRKPKKTDHAL